MTYLGMVCLTPPAQAQQQPSTGGEWKAFFRAPQSSASGQYGGRAGFNGPAITGKFKFNFFTNRYDIEPHTTPAGNEQYFPIMEYYHYDSGYVGNYKCSITANGVAGYAQVDEQAQVVWRWVPRSGYANAGIVPEKLSFLVRASATAYAGNHEGSATSVVSGLDHQGEEVEATFGLAGRRVVQEKDGQGKIGKMLGVESNQLYSIETQGRTEIADVPFAVHVRAAVPAGRSVDQPSGTYDSTGNQTIYHYDDKGIASAEIALDAQLDDRGVSLSRVGAPPAKRSGVPGVTIDESRDEWVDADGTGHGQTLASYKERVLLAPMTPISSPEAHDDDRDVTQTFVATRSGTWSPAANLTYQWTPASIGTNNINSAIQQMPRSEAIKNPEGIGQSLLSGYYGTDVVPRGWLNTGHPGADVTVQYNLTDNGGTTPGATATAKYILKLHDEWENGTPDMRAPHPSGEGSEQIYYVPEGATPVAKTTIVVWKTSQTTSFRVDLKGEFKGGFDLGDWGHAGGSLEASRAMEWNTEWSTQAPQPADDPDYDRYNNTVLYLPVMVYAARRVYKLVDHFGINGYLPDSSTSGLAGSLAGKTPQSKIDDIQGAGYPAWWPFRVGSQMPSEGNKGDTYYKSGGVS